MWPAIENWTKMLLSHFVFRETLPWRYVSPSPIFTIILCVAHNSELEMPTRSTYQVQGVVFLRCLNQNCRGGSGFQQIFPLNLVLHTFLFTENFNQNMSLSVFLTWIHQRQCIRVRSAFKEIFNIFKDHLTCPNFYTGDQRKAFSVISVSRHLT